jgi:hypothetical protein
MNQMNLTEKKALLSLLKGMNRALKSYYNISQKREEALEIYQLNKNLYPSNYNNNNSGSLLKARANKYLNRMKHAERHYKELANKFRTKYPHLAGTRTNRNALQRNINAAR